jgi:hypothetical protein
LQRFLAGRESVVIVGLVSAVTMWIVWGTLDPVPVIQDEISYVFQSRVFATGRWTVPTPPLPQFFQQPHVLTIPVVASKFPPGHAFLLTIGTFLGASALVPLVLSGLTGALLFVLARRVSNPWVALFTCLIWLGDPINLRFRPSYFSEVTTGLLWLVALWALDHWRQSREARWLFVIAAAIGWGAITRPLTMLAFSVPVGVVVLRDVARTKRWRDLVGAAALGSAIVGILPLWAARTTGDWRLWPITLYQRQYLPYDHPGFGLDSTPPQFELSPVNRGVYVGFRDEHANHTIARIPRTAFDRLWVIAREEWQGTRLPLIPFVIVGALSMTTPVVFAIVCSFALFVGYMSYGHWSEWPLYYFEGLPVLSLLAGLGVWRTIEFILARRDRSNIVDSGDVAPGPRRVGTAVALAVVLIVAQTGVELVRSRANHRRVSLFDEYFRKLISDGPPGGGIVFVRYANRLHQHPQVVANSTDLVNEPFWVVHDRPAENRQLMRLAPSRVPMLLTEESGKVQLIPYRELISYWDSLRTVR